MDGMARKAKRRRQPRLELSEPQILMWADAHQARTGQWPRLDSGLVREQLGDNWRKVDTALRYGLRGLVGSSSLARLLAAHRHARNGQCLPRLTLGRILTWADAHHRRTGAWPTSKSGSVRQAPGETWVAIDAALWRGGRGLAGGTSLARLLAARRGTRNRKELPR